jgi:hypothetical protein
MRPTSGLALFAAAIRLSVGSARHRYCPITLVRPRLAYPGRIFRALPFTETVALALQPLAPHQIGFIVANRLGHASTLREYSMTTQKSTTLYSPRCPYRCCGYPSGVRTYANTLHVSPIVVKLHHGCLRTYFGPE